MGKKKVIEEEIFLDLVQVNQQKQSHAVYCLAGREHTENIVCKYRTK